SNALLVNPNCTRTPVCSVGPHGCTSVEGEITSTDHEIVIFGGAAGCDVCGQVRDGRLYVVRPPMARYVDVGLTDASIHHFSILSGREKPSVAAELPRPPAGTSYVQGHVRVW